ncbi:MAG: UDP-N-acetylglucosamine 2-epimerase (non-hydrolyzing) [Sphingobacteriales bacterium]|nr:MAG: UDP-N-acetylglucosamine 2-epimerase (non-hydrolyzing) [Sphingobacteriales bacterium]
MILDVIAGARPNYVKVAALYHAWAESARFRKAIQFRLIETGQHTDTRLSLEIARQLGLPVPYQQLAAQTGHPSLLTASILQAYSTHLQSDPPDRVLVVGDVTSTLACALAARQGGVPVAHVEAGLRSHDESMPEELNRQLTDHLSDLLFTTSERAVQNLMQEGIAAGRIQLVGNTMIDTLKRFKAQATPPAEAEPLQLEANRFFLLTLHRPSNVDHEDSFLNLVQTLCEALQPFPVVLPVHPRTAAVLGRAAIPDNLQLIAPQPYLEFLWLLQHSRGVLTDSGGVSEEATYLQKPCLILRATTERPETVETGSGELEREDPERLMQLLAKLKVSAWKQGQLPPLWDGHAADRILAALH